MREIIRVSFEGDRNTYTGVTIPRWSLFVPRQVAPQQIIMKYQRADVISGAM